MRKTVGLAAILAVFALRGAAAGLAGERPGHRGTETQSNDAAKAQPAPLTAEEREFAIGQLKKSREIFLNAIAGVSEAQARFKPGPARWSVLECAEHLAMTEDLLLKFIREKVLTTPAVSPRPQPARAADEKVLDTMRDRSRKGKAPAEIAPAARFATLAEAKAEFEKRRVATLEYVGTTQDDLRAHVRNGQDAYQYLLVISGHTERHTAQINEVKADPGFPKN
jgi:hypothetical protein